MKAIIVEDERLSIIELRNALAEVTPRIEVAAVARSVDEAALGPGYVSAGIIGQHRIMVNVNRSYLEDASLILDGIRVL